MRPAAPVCPARVAGSARPPGWHVIWQTFMISDAEAAAALPAPVYGPHGLRCGDEYEFRPEPGITLPIRLQREMTR